MRKQLKPTADRIKGIWTFESECREASWLTQFDERATSGVLVQMHQQMDP